MNVPLPDYRVYHQNHIEAYIYDDVGYQFRSGQAINVYDDLERRFVNPKKIKQKRKKRRKNEVQKTGET